MLIVRKVVRTILLVLSSISAAISFLISESKAFEWLRKLPRRFSYPFDIFVGKILSCGYCVGHWAAFGLTFLYGTPVAHYWYPLDLILTTLLVAWLSAIQWIVMVLLFKKAEI